nr:nuclear factor related to kappa B binding [Hymenolepis microstoma]
MVEGAGTIPDISNDSEDVSFSSLFRLLNKDREELLLQLRHRISRLKDIVDEKSKRRIPITPRENDCLRRYSHVLRDGDSLKLNADDRMNKILLAVESHDVTSLENIPLFPKIEESPIVADEDLNAETLISDYVEASQREFTKEDFKNLRIADIIAAVDTESGNSKANKKNKRKAPRPKVAAKQAHNAPPPSKKKKLNDELCNFPPELMQYVRGFFNALRIIMLNMVDSEDGISTEQICEVVRVWSSDHRVRRINSQWISRCEDWSEFVRPALSLLAGKNSTLVLASSPSFVQFNSTTHSWNWLGYCNTLCPEDPVEAAESETAILARLFSLWARRNDLSSVGGSSCKQLPKPSRNEIEHEDDEVDNFSDNVGEQEAPSVATTKSRRRQIKPEQVPPPYYTTDWQCALSTPEQRRQFQEQEEKRFSTPWAPFVYNQHGYASVVAPVFRDGNGNRMRATLSARDHPLLRTDRPPWVSISEIVRDAVARLPNGEGTRPEIAMLVQDSGYLVTPFNFKQLNQCISSALDRLQSEGEKSPVMYDSAQRLWIYRFRHLSANEFFRMYKEQSDYQHKRFQQIYPRARVACGASTGQRSSSAFRGSLGIPREVSRRLSTSVHIGAMNEEEDSIPDIDDLNQEESDDESMSGNDNDDGESYSGSEVETSRETTIQQYENHSQRRTYDASHLRRSQHFQFPPNMY